MGASAPFFKEFTKLAANKPVPSTTSYLGAAGSNDINGVILPSESRGAAAYTSEELYNPSCRGVDIFVVPTAGAGNVTVKLQKKDPNSATWIDIAGATTAAVSGTTAAILTVYPGIAETANVSVSDHIGLSWRVVSTVAAAALTFSVGAVYLE